MSKAGPAVMVAARLREAFEAGDLALLEPLLHPDVRWGGEGDTPQTCHSRSDVLAWYGRRHAAGLRARLTETVVRDQAVVVGLELTGPTRGPDGEMPDQVFQVFWVSAGLVTGIRGYPHRAVALKVADTPMPAPG